MDTRSPLPRRLNGRLQACDPCRRRKVACDHGQPVCKRCRDRSEAAKCVYLANKPRALRSQESPLRAAETQARTQEPTPSPRRVSSTTPRLTRAAFQPHQNPGFLGATSYPGVFNEAKDTLSRLGGFQDDSPTREAAQVDGAGEAVRLPPLRELAIQVLRGLASVTSIDEVRPWNYSHDSWARTGALAVLKHLRSEYRHYLDELATDQELEEFAVMISQNTVLPFSDHVSDAGSWMRQFTSRHLRWESLGLLFAFCYAFNDAGRPIRRGDDVDGPAAFLKGRESANTLLAGCVSLAQHFSAANSVLLRLCILRTTNESKISGDASFPTFKSLSEATAMLTFMGYHAETNVGGYIPSYASEVRRRVTAHAFSLDKICVLFTGRPPQLSRRYITTPPPLDLPDAVLQADEETRRLALATLDGNGWNLDGKIHEATQARGRFMMSLIRDELMEISLGPLGASMETLLAIRKRQEDLFASIPACLKYEDSQETTSSIAAQEGPIFSRMEHLLNLFVADRLLQRMGYNDGGLVATSFELVAAALIFWKHKDTTSRYYADLPWIAMAYATPAGGVLCMELLNPSFTGKHPHNDGVTRSSIIQQLSLLIGFLDWIGPGGTNGDMCMNCRSVIQAVLDHTLNSGQWPQVGMSMDFHFDLFDTFDWLRDGAIET